MNKEMIISSSGHETMAAILEDDEVVEIFVERSKSRGVAGNIYKGRVSKVLPGMQCAFVDLGLERDGFLYVSDVIDPVEAMDGVDASDTDADGDADGQAAEGSGQRVGNGSARGRGRRRDRDRSGPEQKIEKLLTAGQEVMVQVVKEPLGTKGARITSHASIPGRFLVFMPTVDHIGVSRKIASREQRGRLRRIVRDFRTEHGMSGGVIIRTAAADRPKEDIINDLTYFHELWLETLQKQDSRRAPAVIHREESLVAKLLRDLLTEDFSVIRIDDAGEHQKAVKLVERIMPDLVSRVQHYDKKFPIFEEYGVQSEIDKALRSKVWLKSGGYLVINQTEALVAIDVNTGRYVGKRTGRLEDTIVKTNLEAAKEIVRQIRLRDLGGIIVLDFIDMEERKNRQKVYQEFAQEIRRDRSPSKAVQVTEFGLIITTRKRVKQSLERQLTDPCPYCSGSAVVKSTSTICFEILAELRKVSGDLNGHRVQLRVNPDVVRALKAEERGVLKEIERTLGKEISLRPDAQLHHEQFDVMAM
ncbi:MAG: Rne/Rng family ribonuclease [Vicinamibacterales bacterium]|jgi:ribonuclease G|nr:Rne/Rng family ribonuclease [Vicinamibacterales bacterium]MDP7479676.1 Rne/Rng family ribonuclease [Vicinamibacterales bacterium]HJN47092.1 Rne/Rng family ribonuclease [Vicinamibacterales bacterium]